MIESNVKCWRFNTYTMWALALQMEMGPHKDRGKLWPGWDLKPRPSRLITDWATRSDGSRSWEMKMLMARQWIYVDTRKGYVALATYGRVALILRTNRVIESDVKCWCFNPYTMWALAVQMEMGPHKDRWKLWPGWDLNPRPSSLITAAPPTGLQGQTGAGRGKWRC